MELAGQIGKYKIIKKLGSGGFGIVYLAEDTILKTYRALKIPHRIGNQTKNLFEECIVQTKLLDHPHIVKLLTVDIIDNTMIMVMEYIKGTDLEKLIDTSEKLTIPSSLRYFSQILSALDFAHKHKIIHRDIRPSNILIDEKDNVKITDFGTSTLLTEKQFATTKIGSPPYMAPEQFEGRAVYASDIYSAGCLFYEMLTGFPPIVMANPMEIYKKAKAGQIVPPIKKRTSLSAEINQIIMKSLAPDLSNRYKSTSEIIEALNQSTQKSKSPKDDIKKIKERINARETRNDHLCWNCNKEMPRKMRKCLYCGAEQ